MDIHDRDLGFVRFGWRDHDTFTGRWTAPDPMGEAGGDNDWYGYCLDDSVNGVDPLGLKGGFFDGVSKIGSGLNQLYQKVETINENQTSRSGNGYDLS